MTEDQIKQIPVRMWIHTICTIACALWMLRYSTWPDHSKVLVAFGIVATLYNLFWALEFSKMWNHINASNKNE